MAKNDKQKIFKIPWINEASNAGPMEELISFLKENSERQQWQDERFLSLMEQVLIPQSSKTAQPGFGWNFLQDSSSSVPGRYGVPNHIDTWY